MGDLDPLKGARIWLAGSMPEGLDDEAAKRFTAFVEHLSARVFSAGGTIVHGSHPTVADTLVEQAADFQDTKKGKLDCLVLAASKFHLPRYEANLERWRKRCIVHEEPVVTKEKPDDDQSMLRLRHWMADHSDAVIAIGGKWWKQNPAAAGIPQEFELARRRGLPCFLLAGLSGAAAGFLKAQPEVLRNLKNGLSEQENRTLAEGQDIEQLATKLIDQLSRLPLVRGEPLGNSTFRILALDGGGIKGTFTAAVLAKWEAAIKPARLVDHFDLIAGTSTGGILALGLAMGLTAEKLLEFYVDRGPTIFPMTSLRDPHTSFADYIWSKVRPLGAAKYDSSVLATQLKEAFENAPGKQLKDAQCRLVIPAVHARTGDVHVFRTNHHRDLTLQAELDAAKVALATAAAPTYFSAATVDCSMYLDGGLWANNPTLAAVVEAVGRLNVPLARIDILSVGTTSEPYDAAPENAGFIGWLKGQRIVNILMRAQAQGVVQLTSGLTGRPRLLRVDQMLLPGQVSLDNVERIPELRDFGSTAGAHPDTLADVKARFLNGIKADDWTKY